MKFPALIALALLTSCATAQKSYQYMAEAEYQAKPALTQALISPAEPLSESAVQKVLASKVVLPPKITLAIVRLVDSANGVEIQAVDQELAETFYKTQSWSTRVQSVVPVPSLLLSKPVSLTGLRQAAALLQADAILVVKPASYGNWKYEVFSNNKAKGISALEVLLLDTRTSVIPYTSLVTEQVEVAKEGADYSDYEMMARAKRASESKALLRVPGAVAAFLAGMP